MKTARRILAIGTALMMIFGCLTAYAADETTPQKISTDTVLEVDGNILITIHHRHRVIVGEMGWIGLENLENQAGRGFHSAFYPDLRAGGTD